MDKIGVFKRYTKKPSALKYGYYYYAKLSVPFHKEGRFIRVWLPEDYDFNNPEKKFPVIYFSDGQNLVDKYLSAYGEWELDKTAHRLKRRGYPSFIAVGIDCTKDPMERMNELNPPYRIDIKREPYPNHPIGNQYVDYIADKLKPLIDSLFYTIPDKECTAIGGSSMGGIMSFYAYIYRPDIFGFSLSFSPAFFFYTKKHWESILDEYDINKDKNGKLFLYSGGRDFEAIFLTPVFNTYNYLKNRLNENQLQMLIDTSEIHHEQAWAKYLYDALKFWLKD
ncbi:MAG: alpha/beta hydrolase [Bacilli bacterium]|nr:alpha/beta hydrolase [Bacilli bacterium]